MSVEKVIKLSNIYYNFIINAEENDSDPIASLRKELEDLVELNEKINVENLASLEKELNKILQKFTDLKEDLISLDHKNLSDLIILNKDNKDSLSAKLERVLIHIKEYEAYGSNIELVQQSVSKFANYCNALLTKIDNYIVNFINFIVSKES